VNVIDIINKKKKGTTLSRQEISMLIRDYTEGKIPDYQMSAFLMAIYFKGMLEKELLSFTKEMINSGKILKLSEIKSPSVDKHSTGGVGDKISLIVVPIVASQGVIVPMIAGRGLGHTGGTIDKLESIPGFKTGLTLDEFKSLLGKIGAGIIAQTDELVPADRKLYALRDVTGTVDSIPLIASSIMSKKLAVESDGLVLDIKVGKGAFMKNIKMARELARTLVWLGKSAGRNTVALLSDMNIPLGRAIGNALEVKESIEVLKGGGEGRLKELSIEISAWMFKLTRKVKDLDAGRKLAEEAIKKGAGLDKLKDIIKGQGGDDSICEYPEKLKISDKCMEIKAIKSGYISDIDALAVGESAVLLGAGRNTIDDTIDHSVGILLRKVVGDYIKEGEPIIVLYYNDEKKLNFALERLTGAVFYSKVKPVRRSIIYGVIS
jgi:pyrimidine-nucleoside phosphorylase